MKNFGLRTVLAAAALLFASPVAFAAELTLEVRGAPFIKAVHEEIGAAFNEAGKDVRVTITMGPREGDEAVQEILRQALVGQGLPDIVFVDGNLVRLLAERGLAVPLDPFIKADPQWGAQGFTRAVAETGRINGTTYGLAFGLSLPTVLFNSELVRKAGGDPASLPTDWPGILALARRMNGIGENVVGGFIEHDNTGALSFLALLETHGGHFLSEDERSIAFTGPEGERALDVLRGFGEAGQARADMTRDQARQAFGAGNLGVFVTMSSTIPRHEQAAAGRFDVLAVPYPILAENGRLPAAGPIGVMLARDPERQKAAFEVLKFYSGPRGQTILALGSGYAPVNEIAIRDTSMLGDMLAKRRNAHAYLARLDRATTWWAPPGENSVRITNAVRTNLQQVVTLAKSPREVLAIMERETRALLPRTP